MRRASLTARLKFSRKRMLQRKNKPMKKHAGETWKPEPPCPYDLSNAPGYRRIGDVE